MTSEQFCYWLQGHIELNGNKPLDEDQMQILVDHLSTVFNKTTPHRTPGLKLENVLPARPDLDCVNGDKKCKVVHYDVPGSC